LLVTGILIFVIFAAAGAAIKYGKQHWLIAGYNTMPAEKQKNVDLAGLANFMGNSLLGLGAFALLGSLITSRWYPNLFPYVIILCSAGTVLIVLGAQKYDRNRKSGHERAVLIAVLSFTAIVLLATVGLLVYGHLSPRVETGPEGIIISGVYGTTIPHEEITGISLESEIPKILSRNNGFSSGEVRKGNFTLEGMGRGRLYLESSKGPFIFIKTAKSYTIINYKERSQTEALFHTLAK
jgi:hypothetical protein